MKLSEILNALNKSDLQLLVKMIDLCRGRTRKQDLIDCLCTTLTSPIEVDKLWNWLDELTRKAISSAVHNGGEFDASAFIAQYGSLPERPKSRWFWQVEPILLDLFIYNNQVPTDMIPLLEELALPPERFQIQGVADIPAVVETAYGHQVDLMCVETEQSGWHDLLAYLRMVEQNQLATSTSSGNLTKGSVDKLLGNLMDGDFLTLPEKYRVNYTIRPNGLSSFAQGANLIRREQLTSIGQEFYHDQDPELLLEAFETWTHEGTFDELNRIGGLKGVGARQTSLTPPAKRREAVIEALSWCPINEWIDIQDFYRAIKIWHFDFDVETSYYSNLYIGSKDYGELHGSTYWTVVKGLYINNIIWEYLGSIGAVDLAFTPPEEANLLLNMDFRYLSDAYISQYDGLRYFRINPLGAFLLGQAGEYRPSRSLTPPLFTISPDLQVKLLDPKALTPNDQHHLEQVAVRVKKGQYQLDTQQLLTSMEEGIAWQQIADFLTERHQGPLPSDVWVWLSKLQENSAMFKTSSKALFIRVQSAELLEMALEDPVLGKMCNTINNRTLVIPSSKEKAFRRRLKELEYVMLS
ncbi:MAG: hypothetical protein KDJ52_03790 [Anaerolineae bacterium]|nr:hypothetical protein [Anaerolineae bacterium]